jgi:hypothetical protein
MYSRRPTAKTLLLWTSSGQKCFYTQDGGSRLLWNIGNLHRENLKSHVLVSIWPFIFLCPLCTHSSMFLQPFVAPWPLLQFRNLFYTDGRTPWTSDQPVARPLPTRRTTQTQNKRTHKHPCLEWDLNAWTQISSLRPRHHCDRRPLYIELSKRTS